MKRVELCLLVVTILVLLFNVIVFEAGCSTENIEKKVGKLTVQEELDGYIEKGKANLSIGDKFYQADYRIQKKINDENKPEYWYYIDIRTKKIWLSSVTISICDYYCDARPDWIGAMNGGASIVIGVSQDKYGSIRYKGTGQKVEDGLRGLPLTREIIKSIEKEFNDFDPEFFCREPSNDVEGEIAMESDKTISSFLAIADSLIGQLWPDSFNKPEVKKDLLTCEKYGKDKLVYYDFSKIPDGLALDKRIELPADLAKFMDESWDKPKIKDSILFEQDFWEEASKFGYNPDTLKNISPKEAIMAAVEIVVSRFTFCYIDEDQDFISKYGKNQPIEVYFHLKLGDCDKYRDATIAAFSIIKKLNPSLENIYLVSERLGGNFQPHAWVAILIPQEDHLILSHIDPTFYDAGGHLEADTFHICLDNNIFLVYFYKELIGYENLSFSYQILEEALWKIKNKHQRGKILEEMASLASSISIYRPRTALNKVLLVAKEYERVGYTENLDRILYCVYRACLRAGNEFEAEKYRQRLLNEFPESLWTALTLKNQ